jgi:signal transduction histidine kinase
VIEIKISDSGRGIDPAFLPHIFEGFRQADSSSTRRFGGLGLGLAISRHIIELHGGSIKAESAGEEQGSVFTIKIPVLKSDNSSPPPSAAATEDVSSENKNH